MFKKLIFNIFLALIILNTCYSQQSERLSERDIEIHDQNKSIIDSLILKFIEAEEENNLAYLRKNCSDEFSDSNKYLEFVNNNNMKHKVYGFDNDGEYYKVLRKIVHFDFIYILSYETYKKYNTYPSFYLPKCEAIATVKISYKCDGKYPEDSMASGMDIDTFGPLDYVFIKIDNNWKLINIKYAGPG